MKIDFGSVKTQMGTICSLILITIIYAYVWVLLLLNITGYLIMAGSLPVILSIYREVGYNRDAKNVFPIWCVSLMENSTNFGFRIIFIHGVFAWGFANWNFQLIMTAWVIYWLVRLVLKRILLGRPLELCEVETGNTNANANK